MMPMLTKTPTAEPATETALAADISFPAWRAAAVNALAEVHERAARVTHDGFWTRLYVRGLDPEEAAKAAAREYDGGHEWRAASAELARQLSAGE